MNAEGVDYTMLGDQVKAEAARRRRSPSRRASTWRPSASRRRHSELLQHQATRRAEARPDRQVRRRPTADGGSLIVPDVAAATPASTVSADRQEVPQGCFRLALDELSDGMIGDPCMRMASSSRAAASSRQQHHRDCCAASRIVEAGTPRGRWAMEPVRFSRQRLRYADDAADPDCQ
jgi:hypothetical protein